MNTPKSESTQHLGHPWDHGGASVDRSSPTALGRAPWLTFCLLTALVTALAAPGLCEQPAAPICLTVNGEPETAPHLVMATTAGQLVIELYENAAPEAVRGIVDLVRGSGDHLASGEGEGRSSGFYDGLVFDHCKPHIEIRTSGHASGEEQRLPMQLNARALGLDAIKITDTAEAMAIIQNELLAANQVAKRTGWTNTRLQGWMDEWYESLSAEFLVGASMEDVNRGLGYVYEKGLQSRSVTVGSVALVPVSPREASARLSIALTDMPGRTGRWMVIGTVIEGLELAITISEGPLTPEKALKYRPLQPVVIEKTEIECRTRQGG